MKSYEDRDREHQDPGRRPESSAQPEAASLERLAANVGNQAFGALARAGAGILPSGMAHPDVQNAIARRRGAGAPLDPQTQGKVEATFGESFGDVRIHTGREPDKLARAVDARAFTVGPDVYFADGQFDPSTAEGRRLLSHELEHVRQQRGAPTSGPLRVSQPGELLEQRADDAARGVA